MTEPIWLLPEVIAAIHEMVLAEHGGTSGLRDEKILDSALARPMNKYGYEPNSTLFELAAAYSYGLAMDHPYIDGNKRTALIAGLAFPGINGIEIHAPEAETVVAFETLAAGKLTEDELGSWFETHQKA